MYMQLSSLSKDAIRDLNEITSKALSRKQIFAVAVGYMLAYKIDIPTQAVESAEDYFRLQASPRVGSLLSALNELTPFDIDAAMDTTKRFFQLRVAVAYSKNIPIIPIGDGTTMVPFLSLMHVTHYLPQETVDLVNKDTGNLVRSMGLLSSIFRDLEKPDESPASEGRPNKAIFDQK